MKKLFNKKAVSVVEYTLLLVIILTTFLAFQKFIIRGFGGRWKEAGDTFGFGKQYDPNKTTECVYAPDITPPMWYNPQQYQAIYDDYLPKCIIKCQGNDFYRCDGTGPVTCCFGSFFKRCTPNCCLEQCQQRCRKTAAEESSSSNYCNEG